VGQELSHRVFVINSANIDRISKAFIDKHSSKAAIRNEVIFNDPNTPQANGF